MSDHTDLLRRLRELAYDKEARLTGTPMIPLHENTIIAIIDAIEALEADNAALRRVCIDVLAHLVAAHSLLKCGGKKAAPSDKMFNQMLKDYAASIERGRAAMREGKEKT